MTSSPAGGEVSVTRLSSESGGLDEVDGVALSAFDHPQFSVREELSRPWSRSWVARRGGDAVAFVIAWHVADEIHVLNVATLPAARRQGLARLLMQEVFAYAREHQARLLLLEVRRSNAAALWLYRGLGFHTLSVRVGYYGDNGEDAIEMIAVLDQTTGELLPGKDEVPFPC
ncbi:ribosomal protein S18-alanine N-acetyltransferase [Chondromyces crocatus]|uniref:Ribosomal-protein-alanine N-acetyltransferase n=1 Tax=Chondromyces crocatus TaxID=52 RepID=A0A0K1EKJ2_CHOCO|nr:ribosomal protein S18-alanine N-acetyltransferase [Chondromyces crocatus]AKT41390.1 ribosomal-protein-alanine N-acetyltransferase [Chondromyces crocatus]